MSIEGLLYKSRYSSNHSGLYYLAVLKNSLVAGLVDCSGPAIPTTY